MKKLFLFVILIAFLISMSSAYACVNIPSAVLLNDTSCPDGQITFGRSFAPAPGSKGVFNSLTVTVNLSDVPDSKILEIIADVPPKWDMRDGSGGVCASGLNCLKYDNCNVTKCDLFRCLANESETTTCYPDQPGRECTVRVIHCAEQMHLLTSVSFSTEAPLYTDEATARSDIQNFLSKYNLTMVSYDPSFAANLTEELQKYKNYTYICETPNNETGDELRCKIVQEIPVECPPNMQAMNYSTCYHEIEECRWFSYRYVRLTDSDIGIVADFLSNGYSVIRQTQDEYQAFLDHANQVNADISTCNMYSAVAYRDGWTGYVFNDESTKTTTCANAPRKGCGGGGLVHALWNELSNNTLPGAGVVANYFAPQNIALYVGLAAAAVLVLFLLYRLRTRKEVK